ncbi:MAG: hypothetical protein K9N22_08495 [Candidatus Marinimicrobia bacterium]|nr:hypothetical protein [Candidatus Neomarinimicrobiota bacterium]
MNQEYNEYLEQLIIDGPPWEKRETVGFFQTLKITIIEFFRNPARVFAVMRRSGDMSSALQYAVFLQIMATVISLAISAAISGNTQLIPPWMNDLLGGGYDWGTIFLISMPVMVILEQYFKAFFLNLALGMLGQAHYPFDTVFRITAYSNGTAAPWMILPSIGGFIYIGYSFYLMLVGFRTIYGLRGGQFFLAIVLATFLGFLSLLLISVVLAFFIPAPV